MKLQALVTEEVGVPAVDLASLVELGDDATEFLVAYRLSGEAAGVLFDKFVLVTKEEGRGWEVCVEDLFLILVTNLHVKDLCADVLAVLKDVQLLSVNELLVDFLLEVLSGDALDKDGKVHLILVAAHDFAVEPLQVLEKQLIGSLLVLLVVENGDDVVLIELPLRDLLNEIEFRFEQLDVAALPLQTIVRVHTVNDGL